MISWKSTHAKFPEFSFYLIFYQIDTKLMIFNEYNILYLLDGMAMNCKIHEI